MIPMQELRIGNFVWEDYSGDMQISLIDVDNGSIDLRKNISLPSGRYIIEDIEPIPLTEEWLIKFGFEYEYKTGPQEKQYSLKCDNGEFLVHFDKMAVFGMLLLLDDIELKSVHQLQNLYFVLTNKELTIKK